MGWAKHVSDEGAGASAPSHLTTAWNGENGEAVVTAGWRGSKIHSPTY